MEFFNDSGDDPLKPTLFELVAQEQLRDLLQPALKYVLSVFAQSYPRYLLRIVNKHEEFYALLMLFVERHYLRTQGASFAENFYGLKRRRAPLFKTDRARSAVGGVFAEEKLRDREIWRSLVFLVGLPYLRAKAQDYFEELGGGVQIDVVEESRHTAVDGSLKGRMRRAYKKMYPLMNAAFEGWLLVYNIAYLFQRTAYYRPWLSWVGVDLRRLSIDDVRAAQAAVRRPGPSPRPRGLLELMKRLLWRSPRLLLDSLKVLLPTAIFFIKFLEWWYSPSSPARSLSTSPLGPAVPPPGLHAPHPQGVRVDDVGYGTCPLCREGLANATGLPSGYVFCYRCAHDWVEKHGRCPVTLAEVSLWQLRKILVSAHALPVPRPPRAKPPLFARQFGKQIQAEQVPGWSAYYLDYKALKKIISALSDNHPPSDVLAFAPTAGARPSDILASPALPETPRALPTAAHESDGPPLYASLGQDDERGPSFQAHKAAFFFKLERELEKINAFYLEKEAELKLRLETLLSKRRAAAARVMPDNLDDPTKNHVEWSAVEEGFRLLERDIGKLQQFVEINAMGFRKILKKWDKRSRSTTKELYLARQVEIQPVFNRQLISELADTVAACLLDITDLSVGLGSDVAVAEDIILSHQLSIDRNVQLTPFYDLESNLRKAINDNDGKAITDLVTYSASLSQSRESRNHVTRILWKAIIDAPRELADLMLAASGGDFDYTFVDDINSRTCLHEAAIVGLIRLVDLCLAGGVQKDKTDAYGRSALHYAAMHGHGDVCCRLIQVGLPPDVVDVDNCTPLIYATLKGCVACVRALLEEGGVSVQSPNSNSDLMPMSLAARAGHMDVVILLLKHGAPSLPNTNGEYPIHLAAQAGHAEVCRTLADHEGWDVPDKYNDWTPVFHAARFGRDASLQVLLEVGCRFNLTDEAENSPLYYAAWYGHRACVALLVEAAAKAQARASPSRISPLTNTQRSTDTDSDIDAIPSLYLPPPMMPYRVYGHNYLDRTSLIQVTIGHLASHYRDPSVDGTAVRLRHPLAGPQYDDRYLHASPLLKLVMTAAPVVTSAPYSIPLPIRDQKIVFAFQVTSPSALSLEFSLYPNFGTKTIGRATALPCLFQNIQNSQAFVLPILDPRLHIIGEVSFEVNVITPFSGVKLEIGGAVETYWKSLAMPVIGGSSSTKLLSPRPPQHGRALGGSAQTSPTNPTLVQASGHSLTHSSVTGSYIYVTVQVTRDLHPVVFADWKLPDEHYDLGVADATLAQFQALAARLGRGGPTPDPSSSPPSLWSRWIASSMVTLQELLRTVPASFGICVEIAYAPSRVRHRHSLRHQVDLNDMVNSVLRTVYDSSALEGHMGRRPVVFTSFAPDVCAALNWKQPNYPVFFASQCGETSRAAPSAIALTTEDVHDFRLWSLDAAVEFSKMNNLLGVLLDASFLARTPSLIQGVKDFGLLVGTFGVREDIERLPTSTGAEASGLDAALHDGVLTYFNPRQRGFQGL
ncbi:cyclin-dependent protein kinase inhibitor [Epithele typhae]|uniref:cyclin-dependent protein kinase inhibitor n=1 Tax=Epithele typhae TaxID=378194 RepID=UPI002008371A|nr:cyclin-dependent protein kinase inhibitor [Epithele typhae]KAH9943358.1 cyclin-dependent protein kinase inhibitor [Epithele typhae]